MSFLQQLYFQGSRQELQLCHVSTSVVQFSIAVWVLVSHCAAFLWWLKRLSPLQTGTQERWQEVWRGQVHSPGTLRFGSGSSTCSSTSEHWCGHQPLVSDPREEARGRGGHPGVAAYRKPQGQMRSCEECVKEKSEDPAGELWGEKDPAKSTRVRSNQGSRRDN